MGNRRKKKHANPVFETTEKSGHDHWPMAALGLSIAVFAGFFCFVYLEKKSYSEAYKAQFELLSAKGDDYRQVLDVYTQCKNRGSLKFKPSLAACQNEAELSAKYIVLKTPISVIMRDIGEAEAIAFLNAR